MVTIAQKVSRHPPETTRNPPRSGPAIGAIAIISTRVESTCAARTPWYISRTIARASIGPTHAPTACTKRHRTSSVVVEASAHPAEPTAKIAMPSISGILRPMRSLTGPQISCAIANPMRNPVIVSSILPPICDSMLGRPGR